MLLARRMASLARMNYSETKYTKSHEWVQYLQLEESRRLRIGITNYAQEQMEEIIFVNLPKVGANFQSGQSLVTIESVKNVSDIPSPVSGKVAEVNVQVVDNPTLINKKAQTTWLVEMLFDSPPTDLLTRQEYDKLIQQL